MSFQFNLTKITTVTVIALLASAPVAMAHHAFGGNTPTNLFEGFLSGLAHPVIGLDHLAMVLASGLIATGESLGFVIPIAFVLATMAGTAIHLQQIDLPGCEIIIAASVVAFGVILALKNNGHQSRLSIVAMAALGAMAGIFHGYAYGEAIVGAQITPLVAYLAGFAVIQLIIALCAFAFGNVILVPVSRRFVGLSIGAIGIVFLSSSL